MFRNSFQSGIISIFSASGTHPLQLWDVHLEDDGEIRLVDDSSKLHDSNHDSVGPVVEMKCTDLPHNYIICPTILDSSHVRTSLGIILPFLYFTIYLPKQQQTMNHFSIEVTILDDKQITRRFRCSTYQSVTSINADICTFSLRLKQRLRAMKRDQLLLHPSEHDYETYSNSNEEDEVEPCWSRVCLPLAEYNHKAYGTKLVEINHVQIHATNCQIRNVYFTDKQLSEEELPPELCLFNM